MKIVSLSIFIFASTFLFCQEGFDVIRRAEKKIEQGKLEKALKLLDKAGSMNYGFCGNAWIDAREAIVLNQVKIYDAKGEYLMAANTINSAYLYFGENLDSLKMAYFIKSIDKESIKRELDSCINLITTLDSVSFLRGFEFNVTFSNTPFFISHKTLDSVRRDTFIQTETNKNTPLLDRFKNSLRSQPFYQLLQ
jgi:tetratricopeptide (TPR) repeat protein